MTRQVLAPTVMPSYKTDARLGAISLALRWVQEDVTNHSAFTETGQQILLAWNRAAPTNEVQTYAQASGTVTAGNAVLTVPIEGIDYVSGNVAFGANNATVQAALLAALDSHGVALSTRYPAGIAVTGTALPGGSQTITFQGPLGGQVIAAITVNSAGLTGGTYGVTEATPGVGGHVVTIPSAPDTLNRYSDIVKIVGAGNVQTFPFFQPTGWKQSDGNIWVSGDDTSLWFAVTQLPASS